MKTALITGAGGSLGKTFARNCATKGYSLWLVDKNESLLELCKEEVLESYPETSSIRSETVDLSNNQEVTALLERISKESDLGLLINNAAMPTKTAFSEALLQYECDMVHVNSVAPLALTHAAIMVFRSNNTAGSIINVCSLAGLMPGFSGVTYTATKRFMVGLSERLAIELKAKSPQIYVQALCPGIVDTPFEVEDFQRKPKILVLRPEEVVNESFSCLSKGRMICIPGRIYRIAYKLSKIRLLNLFLKLIYTCYRLGIIDSYRR